MNYDVSLKRRFQIAKQIEKYFTDELDEYIAKHSLKSTGCVITVCLVAFFVLAFPLSYFWYGLIIGVCCMTLILVYVSKGQKIAIKLICLFNLRGIVYYLQQSKMLSSYFALSNSMYIYQTTFPILESDPFLLKSTMLLFCHDLDRYLSFQFDIDQINSLSLSQVHAYYATKFASVVKEQFPLLEGYMADLTEKRLYLASLSQDLAVLEAKKKISALHNKN